MLVLSWNVNCRNPGDQIARIQSENPDIVTLQEVTLRRTDAWLRHLEEIGLPHTCTSSHHGQDKKHQCVIASRFPVAAADTAWRDCAPYPEALGRAIISLPDNERLDLFTAHVPDGASHGWKKIDTFHVLAAQLRQAGDTARILTGDFNEPKRFRQSGQVVPWGEEPFQQCGRSGKLRTTGIGPHRDAGPRPITEWTNGVLSVLGGPAHHGLRNAYADLHNLTPGPISLYVRGVPRCYDHIFVSRHFTVLECGYREEWIAERLSDHAPVITKLSVRNTS